MNAAALLLRVHIRVQEHTWMVVRPAVLVSEKLANGVQWYPGIVSMHTLVVQTGRFTTFPDAAKENPAQQAANLEAAAQSRPYSWTGIP